ncbi:MAG: hypothetical protein FWE21_05175 [Defluviitaleaceae bacterium]|nr:hypothetical protein [Defluviitaleaceae bacterium]
MRKEPEYRESQADRLRRRLQERQDRITKSTRPRISPFTLLSIVIILVLLFLVRGGL